MARWKSPADCGITRCDAVEAAPLDVGGVFFSWLGVLAPAAHFQVPSRPTPIADAVVAAPLDVGGVFLSCTFFFTETALLPFLVALSRLSQGSSPKA